MAQQLPSSIEEKVEIKTDLVNKFCINLSPQTYKVMDPKLTNSPGLPIVYSLSDTASVTLKILMDATEIIKLVNKELQGPGTHLVGWDGKKPDGTFAITGKYRVLLYAKRKSDLASCSSVMEFWITRVGITQLSFENSILSDVFPLKFHRQSPGQSVAPDYPLPDVEWKLESLDLDAQTVRPLPKPHDDYPYMGDNDSLTNENNYNYPVAYRRGSDVRIKVKVASEAEGLILPNEVPKIGIASPWNTIDRPEISPDAYLTYESASGYPVPFKLPDMVKRDSNFVINIRFYYADGRIWRYLGQQSLTFILYSTWKDVIDTTYVQIMKWSCQWAPSVQPNEKSFADWYIQRNILELSGVSYQYPNIGGFFTTSAFLDLEQGACGNWASFFYDLLASQGIFGVTFHHVALAPGSPWYNFSECMRADSIQGINNLVQQLIVWEHIFCDYAGEIYDPSFGHHFLGTVEEYFYSVFKLFPIEKDDLNPSYWFSCHGASAPEEVEWFEKGEGSYLIRFHDLQSPNPTEYKEQNLRSLQP